MVSTELFFPDMAVGLEHVSTDERSELVVQIRAMSSTGTCPDCGQPSDRMHSRYVRHPADLPWVGKSTRLLLQVRKFFCTNTNCTRRIFTERLPKLVQPYARRTLRLAHAQRQIGLAVGGRAGSRLAHHVAMPTGRDTLLTLVLLTPSAGAAAPAAKRAARLARFAEVHTLHQQGWSLHAIAAHIGVDRKTARK